MMKRLLTTLFLISFLACSLTGVILSLAAEQAIATAADVVMQPDSAADLIIRSRTTAPVDRSGTLWFGAGILALALVAIGAAVVVMRGGTDFLKQLRLLKKRQRPPQQRPHPLPIQQIPYGEPPTIRRPRRVSNLPELPAWSEDETDYHSPR